MKHITNLFFIISFFFFLFACTDRNPYRLYLERAEKLLDEYPDSAFKYLDMIISPELLNEKDFHKYVLLQVQSKHKTKRDISKDTAIFGLRGYYDDSNLEKAAIIYLYSGAVYSAQKRMEDALIHFLTAEKMALSLETNLMGKIQHFIGNILFSKQDLEESKIRFKKALKEYQLSGDIKNVIGVCNSIGNCYLLESEVDSALVYYEQCTEMLENIDEFLDRCAVLNNLSVGYRAIGDTIKSKEFVYKALTSARNDIERSRINLNLAKLNTHDRDTFYYYMDKSIHFAKNVDATLGYKSNLYLAYSNFEAGEGAYKLALDYHKIYVDYLKEEHICAYESSLNLLQNKFYLKEFEQKNMRLLIDQQRLLLVGTLIIILLLLAVIYIFRQKKSLADAQRNVEDLQQMSERYNEKEKSLRNVVLQNFQILKKVALLESYMISNETNSKFIRKFNEIVYGQDSLDWERLYETINSLHDNLFNKIKKEFLSLTDQEFKICCLTIARLSNSEIGIILNNSASTIQYRKTYIRKKLGIPHQGNIGDFFQGYFDKQSFPG